jgi:hypothetical protein
MTIVGPVGPVKLSWLALAAIIAGFAWAVGSFLASLLITRL